jgi:hypothetical protein
MDATPCVTAKPLFPFFFLLSSPFTFSLYINFKNLIYYSGCLNTTRLYHLRGCKEQARERDIWERQKEETKDKYIFD